MGWDALEALGDAVPQAGGCVGALVGQESGHFAVVPDLVATTRAGLEVAFDLGCLVGLDGVQGEGAQQLFDLVVAQTAHGYPMPAAARLVRMRRSPARILDFTVPSGACRSDATSRYEWPPK